MENKKKIKDKTNHQEERCKLTFYTLVWTFIVGSVFGFCLETVFYYFKSGYIMNRQGVIYGPFSQIYGFGLVVTVLTLYKIRNQKRYIVALASMLVGTIFEYACSVYLEKASGYISWDYTTFPFNLNGRVCLESSLLWGIIGMLYMKDAYPFICRMIDQVHKKLHDRLYKIVIWIFFIFMALDLLISSLAVQRMKERRRDIKAENCIEMFLDKQYPDERLEKIYTSVRFLD